MLSAAIDMRGEVPDRDLHSAGYGQAGGGAGAAHQCENGILNLLCFLPLDLCGEVPDGDVYTAGDGQAGSGAGAAHQGSVPDPNPDPRVFWPPGS